MKNVDLIILTYYINNLKGCLGHLIKSEVEFNNIIIHNDNPNLKLDEGLILRWFDKLPNCSKLIIINVKENLGMLYSRVNSAKTLGTIEDQAPYLMYLDDDDLLFKVDSLITDGFCKKSFQYLPLLKFRDYLTNFGIKKPNLESSSGSYDSTLRYGISGNLYRARPFLDYLKKYDNFLEELVQVWGTSKINASEDDILDTIYYHYMKTLFPKSHFGEVSNEISLGWSVFETLIGKYEHINDDRYGKGIDEKLQTSVELKIEQLKNLFIKKFIQES